MKHGIRAAALSMALALIFAMAACDGEAASAEQGRNIFSTMESGFGRSRREILRLGTNPP